MKKNNENLAEYLLGQKLPDAHIQSYFRGEAYTAGMYRTVAAQLEKALEDAGIPKNSSALLLLDDAPLTLAMFLACVKYGIVPMLLSTFTMDSVVDQLIGTADLTTVISDGTRDLSAYEDRVILAELQGKMRPGKAVFSLKNVPSSMVCRSVDASEIAFFLMTSGSTGTPKVVVHVHRGMQFTTRVYGRETLGVGRDDRIYSVAKTSFGYGLFNNLFLSFASGAAAYLDDAPFDVQRFFSSLETMKPTVFFGIPTAYQMILNYVNEHPQEKKKLSSIKNYISAGEPLNEELARNWKALTGRFIKDNMGSSEASAILLNEGNEHKYGSAGRPVKGSEVRLMGADGKDSRTGSLYFKSKGNAVGYYKNPQEEALHYRDGYLTTGDVFTIDDDGYYWFVGREDHLMKYHGFWVFPQGIERKILEFGGIRQAVVTKATVDGIDLLAAAIIPEESFAGTDALAAFLSDELELYKQPKKYLVFQEFPVNERGKTDLKSIKKMAENDIETK